MSTKKTKLIQRLFSDSDLQESVAANVTIAQETGSKVDGDLVYTKVDEENVVVTDLSTGEATNINIEGDELKPTGLGEDIPVVEAAAGEEVVETPAVVEEEVKSFSEEAIEALKGTIETLAGKIDTLVEALAKCKIDAVVTASEETPAEEVETKEEELETPEPSVEVALEDPIIPQGDEEGRNFSIKGAGASNAASEFAKLTTLIS